MGRIKVLHGDQGLSLWNCQGTCWQPVEWQRWESDNRGWPLPEPIILDTYDSIMASQSFISYNNLPDADDRFRPYLRYGNLSQVRSIYGQDCMFDYLCAYNVSGICYLNQSHQHLGTSMASQCSSKLRQYEG